MLVAGLGNPGQEYERTRHNAGFMALDALAARLRTPDWKARKDRFEAAADLGGKPLLLVKPLTYMNLSGPAVKEALNYGAPSTCLIVCDDMALPLGTLRLRAGGSSGGHHGLDSLIAALGTPDFPRLRIGIGAPPQGVPGADFVLSRFTAGEAKAIDDAVLRAAEAAETWALKGLDAAMTTFNSRP